MNKLICFEWTGTVYAIPADRVSDFKDEARRLNVCLSLDEHMVSMEDRFIAKWESYAIPENRLVNEADIEFV